MYINTYEDADTTIFGTKMGEFTVDGDTYDIWQNTANKEPRVQGDMSFKQYFSIRRTTRDSGHIDITAHFKKWEELDLKLGKITESADSTGTTAISRRASLPLLKGDARVFDMQGRYLGTGEKKISPAVRTVKKR